MRKRPAYSLSNVALLLLADAGTLTLKALAEMANHRRRSWRNFIGWQERSEKRPGRVFSRSALAVALWRLHKQGLVTHENQSWRLTRAGAQAAKNITPPPALPPKDGRRRIVVFDIPETEKWKREWLREKLRIYEYKPLQKSVWLGMRPLPTAMLEEARKRGLIPYLHIFEVSGAGTLG